MSAPGTTPGQVSENDINLSTSRIREGLRQLRFDDLAALALKQQNEGGPVVASNPSWPRQVWLNTKSYFAFAFMTWGQTIRSVFFSRKLDFGDRVSVIIFALGATFVLFLALLWCTITTSPLVEWFYSISLLGRQGGSIDWVNSMNPNLYRNLTAEQSAIARTKLGQIPDPDARNPRVFDLDIARLLLQISALMYERQHIDTLLAVETVQRNLVVPAAHNDTVDEVRTNIAQNPSQRPGRLYEQVVRHNDPAPEDAVRSASQAATRSSNPNASARSLQDDTSAPTVSDVVTAADQASRGIIDTWASNYGVAFEPVSELASLSKAYCSIFWDPKSTWMVVAFKGTDLRWFEEWAVDFTATFLDMSREIPTFHYVHEGFKDRLWPENSSPGERRPWDTISASIRLVTAELARIRPAGTLIDVWFTGHSLGSGMGCLAYSKALLSREELGPHARLRDAYMFAAPVVVDVASRHAFNTGVYSQNDATPRTLWRIINRRDAVATGLPAFGDSDKYPIDPDNLFFFSHIGIGLHLKTAAPTQVEGNNITQMDVDFKVQIGSTFTQDQLKEQRVQAERQGLTIKWRYSVLQNIPLVGRLLSHAPVNYYDQMDKVQLGDCIAQR